MSAEPPAPNWQEQEQRTLPSRQSAPNSIGQPGSRATGEFVEAGAAGGGVGTLIAAAAQSLPAGSFWRSLLTLAAPIIAVGLSGTWLFVKRVYVDPYAVKKRQQVQDAELARIVNTAKETLDRVRSDDNSSENHKTRLTRDVEELETLLLRRYKEQTLRIVEAEG